MMGSIVRRTAAVETFPYYALGMKDSTNSVAFVFENRLLVDIDLGKNWRSHRPKVSCRDMDTGEVIVQPARMTETELVVLLGHIVRKKKSRKG